MVGDDEDDDKDDDLCHCDFYNKISISLCVCVVCVYGCGFCVCQEPYLEKFVHRELDGRERYFSHDGDAEAPIEALDSVRAEDVSDGGRDGRVHACLHSLLHDVCRHAHQTRH